LCDEDKEDSMSSAFNTYGEVRNVYTILVKGKAVPLHAVEALVGKDKWKTLHGRYMHTYEIILK
jgi:hypothetical protein